MPDEEDLICADCGKSQGKKGSITQWMGLGDHCRCHLQADTSSHKEVKQDKQCRRCLKPKATDSQSMTGWLFKRDLCNCKEKNQVRAAPVKVPMSPKLIAAASPTRSNKFVIGIIFLAFCASMVLCTATIPQVANLCNALAGAEIRKGEDRVIVVYDRLGNIHWIRFDDKAIGVVHDRSCPTLRLSNAEISDEELGHLGKLADLENVHLKNCTGFTSAGLAALVQNNRIVSLALEHCSLDQECLNALSCSRLAKLDLSNSNAGKLDWQGLTLIPTLRDLVVIGVYKSDHNKKYLENSHFKGSDGLYQRN